MHFVDLHTHILPALDDGPSSFAEALRMLEIAHRGGTRTLVATPHMFLPPYNNELIAVNHAFARTVKLLAERRSRPEFAFLGELTLHLGSENYLSPEFLKAVDAGRVVPLNDGSYILVEIPLFLSFAMLRLAVERISATGLVPVLAHVERYPVFQHRAGRLAELVGMGCISQLDGTSVAGAQGRRIRKTAFSLLRQDLVHVIASDAHSSRTRTPDLASTFELLRKSFNEHQIMTWMSRNPARLIGNKSLS